MKSDLFHDVARAYYGISPELYALSEKYARKAMPNQPNLFDKSEDKPEGKAPEKKKDKPAAKPKKEAAEKGGEKTKNPNFPPPKAQPKSSPGQMEMEFGEVKGKGSPSHADDLDSLYDFIRDSAKKASRDALADNSELSHQYAAILNDIAKQFAISRENLTQADAHHRRMRSHRQMAGQPTSVTQPKSSPGQMDLPFGSAATPAEYGLKDVKTTPSTGIFHGGPAGLPDVPAHPQSPELFKSPLGFRWQRKEWPKTNALATKADILSKAGDHAHAHRAHSRLADFFTSQEQKLRDRIESGPDPQGQGEHHHLFKLADKASAAGSYHRRRADYHANLLPAKKQPKSSPGRIGLFNEDDYSLDASSDEMGSAAPEAPMPYQLGDARKDGCDNAVPYALPNAKAKSKRWKRPRGKKGKLPEGKYGLFGFGKKKPVETTPKLPARPVSLQDLQRSANRLQRRQNAEARLDNIAPIPEHLRRKPPEKNCATACK